MVLARHGQTSENEEGRILGLRDPPLNATGVAQAERLARRMTNIDIAALWTSPLRRARETADVVGSVLGLDPVELPELRESARGRWEGRRLEQIERDNPALYAEFVAGDPDFAFPGGEPFRTHVVRTRKALTVILSGERPALVITHAGTIRAALAAFGFSLPPESALGHGEVAWPRRLRLPH